MPPKAPPPFSIVSWYSGNISTAANVFIQNVLNYTDDELENKHDFIQLLFPLPWASQSTSSTVVVTKRNLDIICGPGANGKKFRAKMLKSLERTLAMFDLQLTLTKDCKPYGTKHPDARHQNGGRRIRRITPKQDDGIDHAAREKRFQDLKNPHNHHHRRITRIIRSLRICGRGADAESVYRYFRRFAIDHPTIPKQTRMMWGVAANSAYTDQDPREDIKNTSEEIKMGELSDGEKGEDGGGKEGGPEDGPDDSTEDGTEDTDEVRDVVILSGSRSNTGESGSSDTDDGDPFELPGGGTPPPGGDGPTNGGQSPKIGDPRITDEGLEKLTTAEKELHYGRIQHMQENKDIEIGLCLRNDNGVWIAVDEDPMTMSLNDLRIWQLILRDKEEQRNADEITSRRIAEGRGSDDGSSSDGSDAGDPNDLKPVARNINGFGQGSMRAEILETMEPWEKKLHFAIIEHTKDYLDIEIKFRIRDGDGFWRGWRKDPMLLSLRDLKEWQIELDQREADWLDEVMRGDRRRSEEVESDPDDRSDYEIGDPNMSERYFASIYDEDKEHHLALRKYIERFRKAEYDLGYRDRTTGEWVGISMDPKEMNLVELDQWEIDMEKEEQEWYEAQESTEDSGEEDEAQNDTTELVSSTQTRQRQRSRSPGTIEDEKLMAKRVEMGLDPYGDFPEAIRWKAMVEKRERKKAAKAEAERLAAGGEEESDGPGDQLHTEAAEAGD
ncbi:hypothetical protein VE03_04801 [Pseudogymnoascus sp. 23342-1-I1]|nr:hypothetical protein VE03_04801 [Pseudogymnoascus sp. 23342-1-I1]